MKIPFICLVAISLLIFSCTSESNEKIDTITFKERSLPIKGVLFPKKKPAYNYSWSRFSGDSTITLEYVFGNKIYKSFELSGANDKEFNLPSNLLSGCYSFFTIKNEIYLYSLPGALFKLVNDSFALQLNLTENKELFAHKLELDLNSDFGNYVQVYNDSTVILPVTGKNRTGRDKFPLVAFLNIRTGKIKVIDYLSPDDYLDHHYFLNNMISYLLRDHKLLINRHYDPEVEVFDLKTKKVVAKLNLRNKFQEDAIQKIYTSDYEAKSRYIIEAAHYGTLIYNPVKKHYYRLFYHALPEKNESGDFTILADKRSSITVYDQKFKYLGTYLLPKRIQAVIGISPTPEGFIINSSIKKTKSGLVLTEVTYK